MPLLKTDPRMLQSGLLQRATSSVNTLVSITTTSANPALDDTIPQITEGTQLTTVSITPKAVGSVLKVRLNGYLAGSTIMWAVAQLHQGSAADAIAATALYLVTTGAGHPFAVDAEVTTTSLSPITFSARIGSPNAGSLLVNGVVGGGRMFGGATKTVLSVEEWAFPT